MKNTTRRLVRKMVTFSNPSALDPSLQAQTVEERLVDPRLAGLYFGTEQSPGLINQCKRQLEDE